MLNTPAAMATAPMTNRNAPDSASTAKTAVPNGIRCGAAAVQVSPPSAAAPASAAPAPDTAVSTPAVGARRGAGSTAAAGAPRNALPPAADRPTVIKLI